MPSKKRREVAGTKIWLINTSRGFIDKCRYKTVTALMDTRRYYWVREKSAREAFDRIQETHPKLGPYYELWEGVLTPSIHGQKFLYAVPTTLLASKG